MESEKPTLTKRVMGILPLLLIAGLVLVPVGIGFLCTIDTINLVIHEEEYWKNCKDEDYDFPCMNLGIQEGHTKCNCFKQFNITQDIIGDITLYYELESFDQTDLSYANSRDNDQLFGHPSSVPAESCGDFRYDGDTPIFPCGKVADSMFNDTFSSLKLIEPKGPLPIQTTYTGLLAEDTVTSYKNPPAEVWANFTKPKSWNKKVGNVWESGTNTTGVENFAFRSWMNTNIKRKPVWKIDANTTLPAGLYEIRIEIFYPATAYNGSRNFILEGVYPTSRLSHVLIGSISLILGIISLVFALVLLFISKRYYETSTARPKSYIVATLPVTDRISHRHLSNEYEDISEESKLNKNH